MSACMCGFWDVGGGGWVGGLMSECMCGVLEGGGVGLMSECFWSRGGGHVSMGMQDLHLDNIK